MRKKKPFSVYPKAGDLAKAQEIADAEDLNVSQVFVRAFRGFAKRWDRRRTGRKGGTQRHLEAVR